MQVFIVSLMGELSLQCINPGHHRVCLFIGSTKSLFQIHTRKDFKVTDVYLCCGDEIIYRQLFCSVFSFLLEHRSMFGVNMHYTLVDAQTYGEHNEQIFDSVCHCISE